MHIKLIDTSGVEQLTDFEYRKHGHINFSAIRDLIINCFTAEIEKLTQDFNFPLGYTIVAITLEQHKGGEGHATLACFRPEKSVSSQSYQFSVYFSAIELLGKYIDTKNEEYLNYFKNIVLHELVHALDLKELNKQQSIQEVSYYNTVNETFNSTNLGQANGVPNHYNVQWSFLTFLATYRAEGVAILGERLLGVNNKSTKTTEEALLAFQTHIASVFNICGDLTYTGKIETHKLLEIMDSIKLTAYSYADAVLFVMLKERFPRFKDYAFNECHNIPEAVIQAMINEAMALDISEYIQQLLAIKVSNDSYVVDHEVFLNYCGILQKEHNSEDITNFLNGLVYAGFAQDSETYIKAVETIMGSPMSYKDIISELKKIEIKESHDDIFKDIYHLATEHLAPRLTSSNTVHKEIATWALTYFLDDEDLIHDHVKYLGFQDDWIVFNTAVKLIKD